MLDRFFSMLVALSLGFLIWLYARHRDLEALDNVPIPVSVMLPAEDADRFHLEVHGAGSVPVSFSGPPTRLRELRDMLRRGDCSIKKTLNLPANWRGESKIVESVRVVAGDLHPPAGVRVQIPEGLNTIPITLRRLVERRVPVRVDHGLFDRLLTCVVEPATVVVRGPQDILERTAAIPCRPFVPEAPDAVESMREQVVQGRVALTNELDGFPVQCSATHVEVRLTLRPQRRIYEVQVPVHFLCSPQLAARPQWIQSDARAGQVTLRVQGPLLPDPPGITAYIDLTRPGLQSEGNVSQALFTDEPLKVHLPPDFVLAQDPPTAGPFKLVPFAIEPALMPILGGVGTP